MAEGVGLCSAAPSRGTRWSHAGRGLTVRATPSGRNRRPVPGHFGSAVRATASGPGKAADVNYSSLADPGERIVITVSSGPEVVSRWTSTSPLEQSSGGRGTSIVNRSGSPDSMLWAMR